MKLLQYNMEENLNKLEYGNNFLDTIPKAFSKEIIDKPDFIKIKSSALQKVISME